MISPNSWPAWCFYDPFLWLIRRPELTSQTNATNPTDLDPRPRMDSWLSTRAFHRWSALVDHHRLLVKKNETSDDSCAKPRWNLIIDTLKLWFETTTSGRDEKNLNRLARETDWLCSSQTSDLPTSPPWWQNSPPQSAAQSSPPPQRRRSAGSRCLRRSDSPGPRRRWSNWRPSPRRTEAQPPSSALWPARHDKTMAYVFPRTKDIYYMLNTITIAMKIMTLELPRPISAPPRRESTLILICLAGDVDTAGLASAVGQGGWAHTQRSGPSLCKERRREKMSKQSAFRKR